MTQHAAGTFQVTGWEENTYGDLGGGAKLTRARIDQDFIGGLTMKGTSESLMYYAADGTAAFTGLTLMTGQVDGHEGSFVLRSDGSYDGHDATSNLEVVPGSGTGDLAGLRGQGGYAAPPGSTGSYTLDYELG
ncbi:MAG TPA: DUF3224 domain-containing protein [Streptosporangiaceae bacterium]|jgi:hypothetical protein|nr:DUF3224 domain-containing protein [Streptosporangiaceae bacterium]